MTRTEIVHRHLFPSYDEAIRECVSKERALMAYDAFADDLAKALDVRMPTTLGTMLDAVKALREGR